VRRLHNTAPVSQTFNLTVGLQYFWVMGTTVKNVSTKDEGKVEHKIILTQVFTRTVTKLSTAEGIELFKPERQRIISKLLTAAKIPVIKILRKAFSSVLRITFR